MVSIWQNTYILHYKVDCDTHDTTFWNIFAQLLHFSSLGSLYITQFSFTYLLLWALMLFLPQRRLFHRLNDSTVQCKECSLPQWFVCTIVNCCTQLKWNFFPAVLMLCNICHLILLEQCKFHPKHYKCLGPESERLHLVQQQPALWIQNIQLCVCKQIQASCRLISYSLYVLLERGKSYT